MESWGYVSEGKGYASNDTHSPPPTLGRSKSSFLGWELKTFEDHQSFEELGFPDLSHDLIGGHGGTITSTSPCTTLMASPISISGRGDFNSKLSNSVADESNGRDSSLIDLKLGRFNNDHGDAMMDQAFSKGAPPVLPSSESSNAPKRARGSGWFSQTAYCQVYGCNKDLSSCKDYHKRHKVCEVHSKTATVIVNGIEQRFCQQCSRFHLLAEFDDGKRSCRKRLAGHNERRRKPQAGIHSGKASGLLQPCGDSRFQGTMLTPSPFICSEMLPSGVIRSEKYGTSGFWRPTKAEHVSSLRHLSSMTITNEHPQSSPSYNQKQFPFLQETGAEAATGSIFGESNSQYQQHILGAQNSGSRSLFQDTTLGYQDFNVFESFDTASTVQGLSGISDSCCALSLLSSQESQKSSSQSSGIPLDHPFFIPSSGSHHRNSMSQVSGKIGGISSTHTSSCRVSDRFPSELSPAGGSQLSPILISDNNNVVNFEMADGIFQGSDYVNVKGRLSCEEVATIDLLQLSSQLQRVEHQRQSLQVKQENDSSCTLRIT